MFDNVAGTCFMSFRNYPIDEQLCRVLSVAHANSIHEVVLRGSISYNTEFQRPLQYNLELRHLPDNYTFMVLEDAMYSVQVKIGPSGQCLFNSFFLRGLR